MDGFNEKKWFVYVGDHHEGPFSLAEIQGKMAQGLVTPASFAWCEGMADWKAMTDIPEFESVLNGGAGAPAAAPSPPPLTMESAPAPSGAAPATDEKTGDLEVTDKKALKAAEKAAKKAAKEHEKAARKAAKANKGAPAIGVDEGGGSSRTRQFLIVVLVLAALGGGAAGAYLQGYLAPVLNNPGVKAALSSAETLAQPYLLKLAEKVPALAKYVSPIPALEDVAPEEYDELKVAANAKLPEAGPKLALALSKADPFQPAFYVASNLPDGAQIEVYVEGEPDTLLNQLSFSTKLTTGIGKKLGKTGVLKFPDGKPVPRGMYDFYAVESDLQPSDVKAAFGTAQPASSTEPLPDSVPKGRRLLVRKSYFLGGNKDGVYASRLKEFHDKLKQKAADELALVKQYEATLETQLGTSVAKFSALRKGKKPLPPQKKQWNEFHDGWVKLETQLTDAFSKWTPETIEKELFYGVLFQLTQQSGQAVEKVHGLHQAYFTTGADAASFEIQLGEATSGAQSALTALKAKVDQAEKIQPSPNGMPRKEGL